MPFEAECDGMGFLCCHCGGDACICGAEGEPCGGCPVCEPGDRAGDPDEQLDEDSELF